MANTDSVGRSEEVPLHLAGNNAPVLDERDALPTSVVGQLPADLNGQYFRNGPNPRTGRSVHMFAGDGMVHSLSLTGGKASWYRNRFVRTPVYENPGVDRMTLAFDPATSKIDYRVATANTHILEHAGRLLALEEGGFPYEMNADLDTLGPYTFDGVLKTPMTAHPKTCPNTGELLFFGPRLSPPYCTYHRATADGRLVYSTEIDMPTATMMHDFAITATQVILFDSVITFDRARVAEGGSPFDWDRDHVARIGVMPRDGSNDDIRWFEIEPCHLSHSVNAFDVDGGIIITGTRIGEPNGLPIMHEWRVDYASSTVIERPLDEDSSEYPRVPDTHVGLPHRYAYTTSFILEAEPDHHEIYKYDLDNGAKRTSHRLRRGHTCGEPVFVRRVGATGEDEGYLLTFAHDRHTNLSYFLILDATDVGADPIAEVRLPVRVPGGFHGWWVPARGLTRGVGPVRREVWDRPSPEEPNRVAVRFFGPRAVGGRRP